MYVNITRDTLKKTEDGEWVEDGHDDHHKVFLAKVGKQVTLQPPHEI